ncbi:MAG: hypothetical protein AAF532_15030 [Planctomycetota bacterium]
MPVRTLWVANFDFEERLALEESYLWHPDDAVVATLPAKFEVINRKHACKIVEVVSNDDSVVYPNAAGQLLNLDGSRFDAYHEETRLRFWGINRWAESVSELFAKRTEDSLASTARINARSWPIDSVCRLYCSFPPGLAIVRHHEGFEKALVEIRRFGANGWAAKAEYGASGRNALFRRGFEITAADRFWIDRQFMNFGFVVVEPLCDVREEVSFHFSVLGNENFRFDGAVSFRCDRHGKFAGKTRVLKPPEIGPWEEQYDQAEYVAYAADIPDYSGPLGVDVFRYRKPGGGDSYYVAHDVNARMTMGRLALKKADPTFDL